MAKNKKNVNKGSKNKQTKKIDTASLTYHGEGSKVIKCLVVVLLIFGVMYLVTTLILNHSSSIYTNNQEKTEIQYDEILLGTSFKMKDNEYLVLFYDKDLDTDSTYYDLLSDYEAKEDKLPIYHVDLGNKMNKDCLSTEANSSAKNASELKISETTLIKFKDQKIEEFIVGQEKISEYLK